MGIVATKWRSWGAGTALVLLGASAIAACGSDDSGTTGDSTSTSGSSAEVEDSPAAEVTLPEDFCSVISADDVAAIVGAPVTLETGPSGDCEFEQEDLRALSGSLGAIGYADVNGGFEGYSSGLIGSLKDAEEFTIEGLGDAATTFVGKSPMGGGASNLGGGVVDQGSYLVTVTLIESNGMAPQDISGVAEGLLRVALDGIS